MSRLSPDDRPPDTRPLPARCHFCHSKNTQMHCRRLGPPNCNWVECQTCGATSSYMHTSSTPFWKPVWFNTRPATEGGKRGN